MICMTFEDTDKSWQNTKHYNFLKRQALALSEYVLARATLLLHFGTGVMVTEDSCHCTERQQSPDLVCLTVNSEVDHFSNKHLEFKQLAAHAM